MIVVCLVVLVPLIAGVHTVEVAWLARPILVMPPVHLHIRPCLRVRAWDDNPSLRPHRSCHVESRSQGIQLKRHQ